MVRYSGFLSGNIFTALKVATINFFEIYKIKKKNAPTSNRSVLGGPNMLCTKDKYSAIIWVYRNIYNIFVGHMSEFITFVYQSQKRSSQELAKLGRGI